ncbi:transcription initiation factor IID, TAF10 subunit [Basidiobolus meristosporus CBS 931.73]|uniref:Transcription initiation factor TFIID subunit 10 n=1 Tax=Basidiobolus meristosporus CBS 931.73 TaxID=1314790 RepID=A0A1Y1Z0H5_9FUNG|nr:transcription initiation factor IID, TAF10 subunit [Basidiobolus meristosporus CBS 931.73]|eukprot:ORY03624.1 transcription initiation factor IID, TAF10 subunit [Basidiobolus meristosporus CBS 931.73]
MDIDSATDRSTPISTQEKEKEKEKEATKAEPMNTENAEDEDQEETSKNEDNVEEKPDAPLTRKDEEMLRKNKTLAEFLLLMDHYTPIIPDAVTDYYLGRTGFDCDDIRVKRLLALAAQKFIADIATDAFQYCKIRTARKYCEEARRQTPFPIQDKKTVLTMDDLSAALSEYGINIKKPEYFI